MQELIVGRTEEGYKLTKLCRAYLKDAPSSFIYKMLRKKNIVLNDKKAGGDEILKAGDSVKFYMTDETLQKFGAVLGKVPGKQAGKSDKSKNQKSSFSGYSIKDNVEFEDDDILIVYKPAGMLTQKSAQTDVSMNDLILEYLSYNKNDLFKPSVCNRLDRNTSGLITVSKSLNGAKYLNYIISERLIEKYYLALCFGDFDKEGRRTAYHSSDDKDNQVTVNEKKSEKSSIIENEFEKLWYNEQSGISLVKVHLITGKKHQIRAHMSYLGFPIVGDLKYGNPELNKKAKNLKITSGTEEVKFTSQCLTAYQLIFPEESEDLKAFGEVAVNNSKRCITHGEIWQLGKQED